MTPGESLELKDEVGNSLSGPILISLILHAVVLSVIFFSPSLSSRKWTFGPVYSVDLVGPPAGMPDQNRSSASMDKIINQTLRESFRQNTIVLKKNIQVVPPKPAPGKEAAKSESRVDQAIENIKKRLGMSETTSPPGAAPAGSELNDRMQAYYAAVWSRIKSQWALPPSLISSDLEAVMDVKITRDGTVQEVGFEKRSGNAYFDQSAMKAIRKASPFPSIPDWIRESTLEMGIRFHSAELR
jgi:colicin import membrane protein